MAATWTVTGQQANQVRFVAGNPVTGHVVSFQTGDGWSDSVFIPDEHYANVASTKRAIQAAANIADETGALSA